MTTAKKFPPLKEKRSGNSVSYNPNMGIDNHCSTSHFSQWEQ
jgi:hypothetical protein